MINITKDNLKDNLFVRRLEKIAKVKKKSGKIKSFFNNNKAIILLIASFLILAVSNGFLVYNFFKILSKI